MSRIALDGVRKRFGATTALDGVDLEARDGELLVVVGPSGCGKSTLLRCVAGLEAVDEGAIRIGERDVTGVRPAARNVSMVFQSYALFPHLTVRENIAFGLVVREEPKKVVNERVAEASALVGVVEFLERRPYELSGGERQRVALARALVRRPDAFLLDEPLSNLDAGTRVEMRTELRRLHREIGSTMVHVTHDQVEALTLGDRIAVLDAGRVRQVGTPDEVYSRPVDRFVAGFLGTPAMNFLEPPAASRFYEIPDGTVLGVRPEHVRLGAEGVPTRVDLVEVAGSDAYVHLDRGLVARVPADSRPAEGAGVGAAFDRGAAHLFDEATGERREWQ
ncbi:MAG TPA: ABC transporter ATP-binding protein [Gaiellaceae bacterium]|nr:ABC transporter ATP-binding protein [Gaiellaceae bacterium]